MALFRILGDHIVSEQEFARKGPEMAAAVHALIEGRAPGPQIMLDSDRALSLEALTVPGAALEPFPPVGFGLPLTVEIRHVYTGKVGYKSIIDGTGDVAVVSGVKDWSSIGASARALNFVAANVGKRQHLVGPSALQQGTRVVAHVKAVATSQLLVGFELNSAAPEHGIVEKIGAAFTASAGVPLFLPYSGALLAAGQLIPLAGRLADALANPAGGWMQNEELSFGLPGFPNTIADFRLVAANDAGLDALSYDPKQGLLAQDRTPYAGDQPYVVIAVYGGARPELDGFTPAVVGADLLARFYAAQRGATAGLDDVMEIMKVASDMKFRNTADKLKAQLGQTPAGPQHDQLEKQIAATVGNIINPLLKPQ